jgi:hypothetical protein
MDELGGLLGGLIGIIVLVAAVIWLIGIAIGIAVVVGPPVGLGTLIKRALTKRYTLSTRKKWQCAGTAALALALPFLALLSDSSPTTWLAAAWAGTVLGMSAIILFLATSAYRQHFAPHRHSIREARTTLVDERLRQKSATFKLWRINRTLEAVEQRHGGLLRAQESLATQMEAIIEGNDPALCRIKMNHWERQYAALPARRVEEELNAANRSLASVPGPQQAAAKLQSLFLETQLIRRKLAGDQSAARFNELKAERDALQAEVAGCTAAMDACKRVQSEKTAVIAQLKGQKLMIR